MYTNCITTFLNKIAELLTHCFINPERNSVYFYSYLLILEISCDHYKSFSMT